MTILNLAPLDIYICIYKITNPIFTYKYYVTGSYRQLLTDYAAIPRRRVAPPTDSSWFTCRKCGVESTGSCFRCSECTLYPLTCLTCFNGAQVHSEKHLFQTRMVLYSMFTILFCNVNYSELFH